MSRRALLIYPNHMKDPIVLRRADRLEPSQARYWKDLLYRVVKIGTELEAAPPKGAGRPEFEQTVRAALQPSGSLERLGANGVLDVVPEHCGIELRVIGRQPYFPTLRQQYAAIFDVLNRAGGRPRSTCGLHFHLLAPGLAEPLPEIILANLWNLTRRYAPELKFITSCGETRQGLCRRRQYNSHVEMVRHSPSLETMAELQANLRASRVVPEHQNFLNLEHLGFTESGAALPFHLEFRFPDADVSPISVASKTFLFLAMTLKSVDLSQYGLIHVGKVDTWRRKKELLDLLSNNDGNLATSDTSQVDDEVIEELRQGCFELLDLLAPAFEHFQDNPALSVLQKLAERPIALFRCAGASWDEIETMLAGAYDVDETGLDASDRRLMQRIELGEWSRLPSVEAWMWNAARELCLAPQDLERRLERLRRLRGMRWSQRQGTLVFTD
ncbi:MAG TPA: hypothetical protein VHO48_16375 [Anaerolineaceae bacterium]|nr:hypothetical protein [Anaerolineaceae bacterium]